MEKTVKYIFSINAGRSGSHYLSKLFEHVSGCRAFHEPKPTGNGRAMRYYHLGNEEPMRRLTQNKVNKIRNICHDGDVYVETNHCFIKGFGWFIPEYLPEDSIGVIFLTREKDRIVQSLLRVGCSPLLRRGRKWILTPNVAEPFLTPPKRIISTRLTYHSFRVFRTLFHIQGKVCNVFGLASPRIPYWIHNYELECLEWYVDETAALSEAYKKKHGNIKYIQISVDQLNNFEQFKKVLNFFGLKERETIHYIIGRTTNLKEKHRLTDFQDH